MVEVSFNFLKVAKPDFVKLTYTIMKDVGCALAASEKAESINRNSKWISLKD